MIRNKGKNLGKIKKIGGFGNFTIKNLSLDRCVMSQSSLTPTIEKHFADDLCFASVAQLRASPGVTDFQKLGGDK